MPPKRPKVVIIGAGFGGIEAAKALARAPVDVTLIDRQNHHCFQPLLYQVATAALSVAGAMALLMVYWKQMVDYYDAEQAALRQSPNIERGTPDDGV